MITDENKIRMDRVKAEAERNAQLGRSFIKLEVVPGSARYENGVWKFEYREKPRV